MLCDSYVSPSTLFPLLVLKGVNGKGTDQQADSVTGVVSVDTQVGVTAFGVSLGTENGMSNANETGISWSVTNPYTFNQCFIFYNEGFSVHIWLYSNSTCP